MTDTTPLSKNEDVLVTQIIALLEETERLRHRIKKLEGELEGYHEREHDARTRD